MKRIIRVFVRRTSYTQINECPLEETGEKHEWTNQSAG